jgi:hypothetical protein
VEAVGVDAVKIGVTARGMDVRLSALATGSPHELRVLATIAGDAAVEQKVHAWLARHRIRGEWFRLNAEVKAAIAMLCRGRRVFSTVFAIDDSLVPVAAIGDNP